MSNIPLKGWPSDVIKTIFGWLFNTIDEQEIVAFYIGRTNDITSAKKRYGCDEIFTLYETDNADNAIDVEDALIKIFSTHPKCDNDFEDDEDKVSDEYLNYVYVAVWY